MDKCRPKIHLKFFFQVHSNLYTYYKFESSSLHLIALSFVGETTLAILCETKVVLWALGLWGDKIWNFWFLQNISRMYEYKQEIFYKFWWNAANCPCVKKPSGKHSKLVDLHSIFDVFNSTNTLFSWGWQQLAAQIKLSHMYTYYST